MDIDQQEVAALERRVGDQAASPLFAKLAYLYLESGRAQDALRVCDAGLANFPFYSTGHLIKGKTLLFLGLNGEARREFEFVRDWLPFNASVAEMLKSVPVSEEQILGEPLSEDISAESSEEATVTVSAAEETVSGFDAVAQIEALETMPDETVEDDFEVYAERKRGELGATGETSLEAYLASPFPEGSDPDTEITAEPAGSSEDAFAAAGFGGEEGTSEPEHDLTMVPDAPDEPAESSEDAFAAAGFGMAEETSEPDQDLTVTPDEPAEDQHPEFGGFGESQLPIETAADHTAAVEEPVAPSGGFEEATESAPPEFGGFGEPEAPAQVPSEPSEPADTSGLDAFGISGEVPEATHIENAAEPDANAFTESPESDIFAGFVGPDQATGEDTTVEEASPDNDDKEELTAPDFSGLPGFEENDASEEESLEKSDAPADGEGFSGPPPEEPAAPTIVEDKIGDFTEKLQNAKKITPVIDLSSQVSSTPSSADEAAADAGFVTPTLAEIYAKQGWYDDAINAYKTLAKSRPAEKDKFEERVKELEEEKAKAE